MSFYKKSILVFIFIFISFTLYITFGKVDQLILSPLVNFDAFISQSPYIIINGLIIQQPSSSLLILVLALITCLLGIETLSNVKINFIVGWESILCSGESELSWLD